MTTTTTATYGFCLTQDNIDWLIAADKAQGGLLRGTLREAVAESREFCGGWDVTMDCIVWMRFGEMLAAESIKCDHFGNSSEQWEFARHIYRHAAGRLNR